MLRCSILQLSFWLKTQISWIERRPLMIHTIVVWISNISPMAIGCFICVNISLVIVLTDINSGTYVTTCRSTWPKI